MKDQRAAFIPDQTSVIRVGHVAGSARKAKNSLVKVEQTWCELREGLGLVPYDLSKLSDLVEAIDLDSLKARRWTGVAAMQQTSRWRIMYKLELDGNTTPFHWPRAARALAIKVPTTSAPVSLIHTCVSPCKYEIFFDRVHLEASAH